MAFLGQVSDSLDVFVFTGLLLGSLNAQIQLLCFTRLHLLEDHFHNFHIQNNTVYSFKIKPYTKLCQLTHNWLGRAVFLFQHGIKLVKTN